MVLGGGPPSWPRVAVPQLGRITAVAAAAAVVALLVAPIAPTIRLPPAIGGFVVGFTTPAGAAILAYEIWHGRSFSAPAPIVRPSGLRLAVATPVLIGYAAATIAVPLHLGLTNAIPVGARWWLLAVVWVGFAVPLIAILLLWQAIWSAILHRFSAPPWLISLVGSLLVAWPIAIALPKIG